MLATWSETFCIQNVFLYDIPNARSGAYSGKMSRKCRYLRLSELNGRLLSAGHHSQNLFGNTLQTWATFSLCLRFIDLLVFDLFYAQKFDKFYFMLVSIETLIGEIT